MGNFFAGVFVTLLVLGGWHYFTIAPSADRAWIEEQARTATAEVKENSVTLHNVRDWTYDATGPLSKDWIDMSVNPKDIRQVWFIIEPFSKWKAVGHTFLSFEFNDGRTLSFSVEARREEGESYQAIQGTFRSYELAYQWGTERDLIPRRLVYLNHPLRMYPLTLPPGGAEALFNSLIGETNELAAKPRFYNTLTANCTNILAQIVNEHYPRTLPSHYSWTLTGYSDTYLMREEFIEIVDASETRTQERYDLTPFREGIGYAAVLDPVAFSDVVRINIDSKQ